jgi:O-antigen ligase
MLFAKGGVFAPANGLAAALLAGSIGVAASAGRLSARWVRSSLVVSLLALGCWAVVRAAAGGAIRPGLGTAAVVLGCAAVFVVVASATASARRWLLWGVLAAGVVVALSGWLGLAWRIEPLALPGSSGWRAATTITYANGAAAVLSCLGVVLVGRLAELPGSVATGLATTIVLVGLGITQSRAGALAFACGIALVSAGVGIRRVAGALVAPAFGALIALAGIVPSIPHGAPARPGLAAAGLVAGVAATYLLSSRRRVGFAGSGATAAAAVGIVIVGVFIFANAGLGERLAFDMTERWARSSAAFEQLESNPVFGIGPGPLWLTWQTGTRTVGGWHVHNEYVQILVQLGIVGGVLVLFVLFSAGRMITRYSRALSWEYLGGLLALAVHSAFDFLWHIPVIPLLGALLVALGTSQVRREVIYATQTTTTRPIEFRDHVDRGTRAGSEHLDRAGTG